MRILHAIHDFLPRHRAGSEIYAFELARELSACADVFVLAAEYDPGRAAWDDSLAVVPRHCRRRDREQLAVSDSSDETYSSERINAQFRHVLDATRPDVLHVHNLLNLSFDLPRIAKERGIATVATLHDYTLVCPSGGQRVHVAESHVCESIDPDRCARCFSQSPLSTPDECGATDAGAWRAAAIARAGRAAYSAGSRVGGDLDQATERPRICGGRYPAASCRRATGV